MWSCSCKRSRIHSTFASTQAEIHSGKVFVGTQVVLPGQDVANDLCELSAAVVRKSAHELDTGTFRDSESILIRNDMFRTISDDRRPTMHVPLMTSPSPTHRAGRRSSRLNAQLQSNCRWSRPCVESPNGRFHHQSTVHHYNSEPAKPWMGSRSRSRTG